MEAKTLSRGTFQSPRLVIIAGTVQPKPTNKGINALPGSLIFAENLSAYKKLLDITCNLPKWI